MARPEARAWRAAGDERPDRPTHPLPDRLIRAHHAARVVAPQVMTTTGDVGRGAYQRVTDPSGTRYLLQAVPSGYLGFSVHQPQGPVEVLIQTVGARIVNRLVFRGGWTLLAWRSDAYAPKRERVHKERFAGQAEAVAAFDRLAVTIRESGPPAP